MGYKLRHIREVFIDQAVGVSGAVCWDITDPDGVNSILKGKNQVTNTGLALIAKSLLTGRSMPPRYIALGDSDANSTANDIKTQTELDNEIARINIEKCKVTTTGTSGQRKILIGASFGGSDISEIVGKTVRETGLFDRYTTGSMYARKATEVEITINSGSTYNPTWEIVFTKPSSILDNGGIVDDGLQLIGESLKRGFGEDLLGTGDTYPWFLNKVKFGTSTTSTTNESTGVISEIANSSRVPDITNIDLTNPEEPKIKIQAYIPASTIATNISEIGLFNSHSSKTNAGTPSTVERMFSRVALSAPILANQATTITWQIIIKRSE